METVKISKGRHFLRKGDKIKGLFVILQGSVRAVSKNDEMDMQAGSIVGMLESASDSYLCDYVANTDCVLYAYPYRQIDDYKKIFASDEKYVAVFTMGAMHQAAEMLGRYDMFCKMAQRFYKTFSAYFLHASSTAESADCQVDDGILCEDVHPLFEVHGPISRS